jgi:tetratricopeptide (TPR) repeat protein
MRQALVMYCVVLISVGGTAPSVFAQNPPASKPGEIHAGVCRNGPCSGDKPKCDQDALQKAKDEYQRKKKVALDLYAAADDALKHSTDGIWKFLGNFGMGTYEGVVVKGPVILEVSRYKTVQLKLLKRTRDILETQEALAASQTAEVTLETADWAAIPITLEQMIELRGEMSEAYQRMEDANKMVAQANKMYDEALAALDRVIALERQCDEAKQADRDQNARKTLGDKAHDLMESWQNNGVLYRDPSTGQLYDAQGAFTRAKAILTGGQQNQSKGSTPRFIFAAARQQTQETTKLTAQQLKDAITALQSGTNSFSAGMDTVINWLTQEDQVQGKIQALTDAIKSGP